ncbi:hypothetical protein IFM89_021268 [Coptis chinensis]|uniref:Uncharacterized protein n=1 Tax=Coptis chinensis TaxID=261450 RepID=A0A835HX11_9MAGN|nr:hypothetical protein IFM89_021268 [Coptis chinensis]
MALQFCVGPAFDNAIKANSRKGRLCRLELDRRLWDSVEYYDGKTADYDVRINFRRWKMLDWFSLKELKRDEVQAGMMWIVAVRNGARLHEFVGDIILHTIKGGDEANECYLAMCHLKLTVPDHLFCLYQVLLQGLPRNALPEDIERFLCGCDFNSSSLHIFLRQSFPDPVRMALVQFPSEIEAMNAVIVKNRSFCLNNQILMRVLQ